ncbi:hypothetical protein QE109_17420 [Fusibacter bizertensis]|uniref:Uncharacterized protein n=1 Tax=Fusibacter bizertensis TaxID=1488331 RepID=A0ABT6NHP4_9FIRM|nr:hypothetical protein [Fusibacter bizertensis]MDH8679931.1 hypothetical protein [Fusibacter bizertensis]
MIYLKGYREKTSEGWTIQITKHITEKEYNSHKDSLADANKINAMTDVHNLVVRNGSEFLDYSSRLKNEAKIDKDQYFEANRLLVNFLSSVSMFIDYGEKYHSKYFGKDKMREFQNKTHFFYDNHISYRFIAILRNYAMHYGFLLFITHTSLDGTNGLFASKKNLLRFKDWKHVKEDIEKMPELISFDIHVEIAILFLKHLYESFIYDIAPIVLEGIKYYNNLIKESNGYPPILAKSKNEIDYKSGILSLSDFNPNDFAKALEVIKNHPRIEVNFTDERRDDIL